MPKHKHLNSYDRQTIATLLNEGRSMHYIAGQLGCSPSTVSREISNHLETKPSTRCDCLLYKDCSVRKLCNPNCRKPCRACKHAKSLCSEYAKSYCDKALENRTGTCNFCKSKNIGCGFDRHIYNPVKAQKEADTALHDTRKGRDISTAHIDKINSIVTPLLKRGHSVYSIIQTHGNELGLSESTLRRMINDCDLDARNIDLRDAVKRKPRRKKPHK